MPYAWDAILQHVATVLRDEVGVAVKETDLVAPPDPTLGDLAYACFAAAKVSGKKPNEIAAAAAEKLKAGDHSIETVTAAGPYINIMLRTNDVVNRVVKDVENQGAEFGKPVQPNKGRVMVEYAQPNTHKEIHVGHLRNLALGSALVNLFTLSGWNVVAASYHGDVGAHVSKCLWFFVRKYAAQVKQVAPKRKKTDPPFVALAPDAWAEQLLANLTEDAVESMLKAVTKEERNGRTLGQMYAEATKVLEENEPWKPQVSDVMRRLEAKEAGWTKLWRETRRWSVDEMAEIFQDLGVKIDRQYFESEVVDEGQQIVDRLLAKEVARESQGAIVIDLEDQKLGVFLIRKSDGTALYATKDLALAYLKVREYPDLTQSLMVVDNRQTLYFKQLFATLKLMGFTQAFEFAGYEFLTLKTGAMSSREGNVVTWQSFREELYRYAVAETRKRHPDWNEGKITHTAWCLMMGGMKFGMLKQDGDKIIVFDMEKLLSFDGDTGPYVQYAVTRLGSILRRAAWKGSLAGDLTVLMHMTEKRLATTLAAFPGVVARSAAERRPAVVCQWCLDAATRVNEFYRDANVLDAPDDVKAARLRLVAAARSVLAQGLALVGISVPEEM